MLWIPKTYHWLRAVDDPPHCDNFLVFLSKQDAEMGVIHQWNTYEIESIPVRVK